MMLQVRYYSTLLLYLDIKLLQDKSRSATHVLFYQFMKDNKKLNYIPIK